MSLPGDPEQPPIPLEPPKFETEGYGRPPLAPMPAPPERVPFWGYSDLVVFMGLAFVSLLAGFVVVKIVLAVFHLDVRSDVVKLLPGQFLGYLFLFLMVGVMFRVQYGRPFWQSIGWTDLRMSAGAIIGYGVLLAFAIGFASKLLQTPEIETPMSKMLSDRTSLMLVAVFGITFGPLCEELIFRGFLQPLFVRSLGAPVGILMAAVPFGLLHLQEYGNSWRHGLLITLAGTAFGWMRHRTGSVKASTFMHAAYNATFFLALLAARWKDLPHA